MEGGGIPNIDDLPDAILVGIFSRLACSELVSKYKCVCKRWRNLLSDPWFNIDRFPQQQVKRRLTLVNQKGEEFCVRRHSSTDQKTQLETLLTQLFKKLKRCFSLRKEPIVVGACNDLILCCATEFHQRDYFICNPYTSQWVALPRPSRVLRRVPVGFICDTKDKEDVQHLKEKDQQIVNVDLEYYRYKVVRILPCHDTAADENELSSKFEMDVFSCKTGEWRETAIAFPRCFRLRNIIAENHFTHNGMLIWFGNDHQSAICIDPFGLKTTSNYMFSRNIHRRYYKCHFIELRNMMIPAPCKDRDTTKQCLFAPGGSTCDDSSKDYGDNTLIWFMKLKKNHKRLIGFDPNDEDIVYISMSGVIVQGNIRTHVQSVIDKDCGSIQSYNFFPLVKFPSRPTPVPRLPPVRKLYLSEIVRNFLLKVCLDSN